MNLNGHEITNDFMGNHYDEANLKKKSNPSFCEVLHVISLLLEVCELKQPKTQFENPFSTFFCKLVFLLNQ